MTRPTRIRIPRLVALVGALVLSGAAYAGEQSQDVVVEPLLLGFPGFSWSLAIDLPGFTLGAQRTTHDGYGVRRRGFHEPRGLVVSSSLDPAEGQDAAARRDGTRDDLQRRGAVVVRRVRRGQQGEMASLEYIVAGFSGVETRQRHVHVFLTRDDLVAEVHLSETLVGSAPSEEGNEEDAAPEPALLDQVLDSVRLIDREAAGAPQDG